MPKKIYDIVPSGLEIKGNEVKPSAKKGRHYNKISSSASDKSRSPLRGVFISLGIIAVLFSVYFISKLPRINVQIWPKTDTLVLEEKIVADKSTSLVSLSNKVIPASYIEEEQNISQEFEATGIASNNGKSSGTIKIYNKTNPPAPITLKTGTHFLSDSGKYFVILDKVTVPAMKGKSLGSIEVKVQAKEIGQDSNIGPSKFSVPKLSGTPYYYSIYAESESPMIGGYKGTVKKITKNDILNAKETLAKNLLSRAEESLKRKISSEDVLLDDAILRQVIETTTGVKPDTIADSFTEQVKVKISALVFKKQDLEELVQGIISLQLPESKTFLPESLDMNYSLELIDMKNGLQTLDLKSSVKTYHKMDTDNLTSLFKRKSSDQIKNITGQMYGDKISHMEVKFWPFWVKHAPKSLNRIKVRLNFE